MDVNEVDTPEDVASGNVLGVKNAAVRKLEHELGIPIGELKVEEFKFLTRLHYWAADTVTHGKKSPWGEHEIDYVLFITIPDKSKLTLKPHPDEVDDTKWVTQSQLLTMFNDKSLLFSPWFRLITNKWMIGSSNKTGDSDKEGVNGGKGGWWDDLSRTMNTNDFIDYETIHTLTRLWSIWVAGVMPDQCLVVMRMVLWVILPKSREHMERFKRTRNRN